MCRRVTCPNDGKPTWWGCGKHIEAVLGDVPESERCECPHEPVAGSGIMLEVKKRDPPSKGKAALEVQYEA